MHIQRFEDSIHIDVKRSKNEDCSLMSTVGNASRSQRLFGVRSTVLEGMIL
jgi:hypothetical protein